MRVFAIVLFIALLGAEPAPSPPSSGADRLQQLIGAWSCRTAYRDPAQLTVTKQRSAIVMTENVLYEEGRLEHIERFVPNPRRGGWRVESDDFDGFEGAGPAWTGDAWTLEGRYQQRPDTVGHARFERPDDRTLRIVRWLDVGNRAITDGELCYRGGDPPDRSTCIVPNLPARTVYPVPPVAPIAARYGGISGVVQVGVSLDADSHIVRTRIVRSPFGVLNESALKSAGESIYRTQHRDCQPMAGDYVFLVYFNAR